MNRVARPQRHRVKLCGRKCVARWDGERYSCRNWLPEIGITTSSPDERLHPYIAIPPGSTVFGGVINDPILGAIERFRKATVPRTVHRAVGADKSRENA